jgi:hypothetical protein
MLWFLRLLHSLFFCTVMLTTHAQAEPFHFAVLMHVMQDSGDENELRNALESAQAANPTFIVVNGMRSKREPCTDRLYRQRTALLESSVAPVVLSLAGDDWISCRDRQNRPAPTAWLNLLRDQVYGDISWSGGKHIPLRRQSAIAAFRNYAENTRWSIENVLFATLNVPANNNNYLASAGGNSEFEDRQIANRDWLHRLITQAQRERKTHIVLFCDGNPLPDARRKTEPRDGYIELRQQLKNLAEKSGVKILVIQGSTPASEKNSGSVIWNGRLGYVNLSAGINMIAVDTSAEAVFSILPDEP